LKRTPLVLFSDVLDVCWCLSIIGGTVVEEIVGGVVEDFKE